MPSNTDNYPKKMEQQPQTPKPKRKYRKRKASEISLPSESLPTPTIKSNSPRNMTEQEILVEVDKVAIWNCIVQGLAASGELSPETLGAKGGAERVKTLAVHAAGLAKVFHAEYVKANG